MTRLLPSGGDDGRIPVLVAGFLGILMMLVLVAVDVTAVQLARMRVLDAADAAAADAADAVDERAVYGSGVDRRLRLSTAGVQAVAMANLGRQQRPRDVTGWEIAPGSGSPDGQVAVVHLRATIRPPVGGPFLPFVDDVQVQVESRARADVQG